MQGKFEVYRDEGGEYRFRLKSGNGEIILASEGYRDRVSAFKGVEAVKKSSNLLARFEKKISSAGKPYFVLKAANHEVIAVSESYSSDDACDNGIKSVIHVAPLAHVDDRTA